MDLQVDVGNLSLAGLNSVRSLISALSTDDVQPAAMLQVQDLGSLFHANGKYASIVADELQRCPSHRLDMLSSAIGWRRGDATSLLAQSAGGQAAALLALFLRNTYSHAETGEIVYRFSQKLMPRSRCVATVKQLADVATKVSGKVASLGYSNFMAEQVTRLRLAYLQFGVPMPTNLLDELTEEGIVEVLCAISRAQREPDVCARIIGTRAVGHIMTLLLVLCANDVEISVEGIVMHSGEHKCIFLQVAALPCDQEGWDPLTRIQMETNSKPSCAIDVPISDRSERYQKSMFLWDGWLDARLQLASVTYGLLQPHDMAADCCDFIWNLFQPDSLGKFSDNVESWSPDPESLGPQAHQRIHKALKIMFHAHTWSPTLKDPMACLEAINDKIDAQVACHHGAAGAGPTGAARNIILEEGKLTYDAERIQPSQNSEREVKRCSHRNSLWQQVVQILRDGYSGLYIDAGPKAAVSVSHCSPSRPDAPMPWRRGWVSRLWLYDFSMDWPTTLSTDTHYFIGQWNGSSVLYPAMLSQMRLSSAYRHIYEMRDGCFTLNGRYFDYLEAGVTSHNRNLRTGAEEKLENLVPCRAVGSYSLDRTFSESFSSLKIWTRVNVDNHVTELNLCHMLRCHEEVLYTKACDHPFSTPLDRSLHVRVPVNIFEPVDIDGKVSIYMTHKDPQLQLLCLANARIPTTFLLMRNCCLNCAVRQARKYSHLGIIPCLGRAPISGATRRLPAEFT